MIQSMFMCQKSDTTWFPFGSLITKILIKARVNLDNELLDSTCIHIDSKSLGKIKVRFSNEDLENVPTNMETNDDEAHQGLSTKGMFSTIYHSRNLPRKRFCSWKNVQGSSFHQEACDGKMNGQ